MSTRKSKPPKVDPKKRFTIDEIFDMLEPLAREKFEKEGLVVLRMLICAPGKMLFVANVDAPPDIAAAAVRELAVEVDAYAIASMAEMRIIRSDRPREELPATFAGHPDAVEAVTIMVEHRDGFMMSRADIERAVKGDESSAGTLQPFVRQKPDRVGAARLTHLLPGARDN